MIPHRPLRLRAAVLGFLLGPWLVSAGELVQFFPAHRPKHEALTAWRVRWGYTQPGPFISESNLPYLQSAAFMRKKEKAGTNEWVTVVGEVRLAELYTPYNQGLTIYDVSDFNFQLVPAQSNFLWPSCVVPGQVLDTYMHKEIHDDDVRWMDTSERVRRGQEMALWSVLNAGNYRYLVQFAFRDDGALLLRVGATAQNLFPQQSDRSDVHLHVACWRIEPHLNDPASTRLLVASRRPRVGTGGADLDTVPFAGGLEGGIPWTPQDFTTVSVESLTYRNDAATPQPIAYDILPLQWGVPRSGAPEESFTTNDIWLSAAQPLPELRFRDVVDFITPPESMSGRRPVLWIMSASHHAPRDEDFGGMGNNTGGVALTMWSSVLLKPRNLFGRTPLR